MSLRYCRLRLHQILQTRRNLINLASAGEEQIETAPNGGHFRMHSNESFDSTVNKYYWIPRRIWFFQCKTQGAKFHDEVVPLSGLTWRINLFLSSTDSRRQPATEIWQRFLADTNPSHQPSWIMRILAALAQSGVNTRVLGIMFSFQWHTTIMLISKHLNCF